MSCESRRSNLSLLMTYAFVISWRVTCLFAFSLSKRGHSRTFHWSLPSRPVKSAIMSDRKVPRFHFPHAASTLANHNFHHSRLECVIWSLSACQYTFWRFSNNTWHQLQFCLAVLYSLIGQSNKINFVAFCVWETFTVWCSDCTRFSIVHHKNYSYHPTIYIAWYDKSTDCNLHSF